VIELMKEEAGKRRKDGDDAEAKAEDGDKTKWMSTAQLWVDSRGSDADSENDRRSGSTSPASRLLGGAEESSSRAVAPPPYFRREERVVLRPAMPLLPPASHRSPPPAAAAAATAAGDDHRHVVASSFATAVPSPVPAALSLQAQAQQQQQQARKSRRCWSPELHRQFVAALQQLGGPQGILHGRPSFSPSIICKDHRKSSYLVVPP
jgi:hypothetical protein